MLQRVAIWLGSLALLGLATANLWRDHQPDCPSWRQRVADMSMDISRAPGIADTIALHSECFSSNDVQWARAYRQQRGVTP
jgi:hypothetical protein